MKKWRMTASKVTLRDFTVEADTFEEAVEKAHGNLSNNERLLPVESLKYENEKYSVENQ